MRKLQTTVLAVLLGFTAGAAAAPGTNACKHLKSRSDYLACVRELARVGEHAAGMTPAERHQKIGAVQVWMKSSAKRSSHTGAMSCTRHGAVTTCTTAQ